MTSAQRVIETFFVDGHTRSGVVQEAVAKRMAKDVLHRFRPGRNRSGMASRENLQKIPPKWSEEVLYGVRNGLTDRQIAKKAGVEPRVIRDVAKRIGVQVKIETTKLGRKPSGQFVKGAK